MAKSPFPPKGKKANDGDADDMPMPKKGKGSPFGGGKAPPFGKAKPFGKGKRK